MDQERDGNTMTSYDLIDGKVQIRNIRSRALEILAEGTFADSGLAKQLIVEMSDAAKGIQKNRSNVTERVDMVHQNWTRSPRSDRGRCHDDSRWELIKTRTYHISFCYQSLSSAV